MAVIKINKKAGERLIHRPSSLEAARQILSDNGQTQSPPVVQTPRVWPRWLLFCARILLIPVVAVARIIALLEEKISPYRPHASDVGLEAIPKVQV